MRTAGPVLATLLLAACGTSVWRADERTAAPPAHAASGGELWPAPAPVDAAGRPLPGTLPHGRHRHPQSRHAAPHAER